jgi:IstB-like ATP binding protein
LPQRFLQAFGQRRFRTTDFSLATVTVTRSGTISIRGVLYTVPSRLVGSRLKVHIYDDRLSCWLGTAQVLELPRRHRPRRGDKRVRVVDYRHLAGGLIRKPQAFRRSVFRDELFPRAVFPAGLGGAGRAAGAACRLPGIRRPVVSGGDARLRGGAGRRSGMTDVDAARLPLMLATLRLPTIGRHWQSFAQRADAEGWGAARYLGALCEHELAERAQRRITRHLRESGLPAGKTFATFDFSAVPTVRKGTCWRSPKPTAGSNRAPISCVSARRAPARVTPRLPSATRSSNAAGACCSVAPPTWCNGCKRRGGIFRCRH